MFNYNLFMFLEMCPPLISDSLDIKCSYNGKDVNCSNLSIVNTTAIPRCKPKHYLPNGKNETPLELHCQLDGSWDKELIICQPGNCIFNRINIIHLFI